MFNTYKVILKFYNWIRLLHIIENVQVSFNVLMLDRNQNKF